MPKPIAGLTADARALHMTRNYIPVGSIRWRLGHIHVGTSALTVAREFWHERCRPDWPRSIKRAVVRAALKQHQRNRQLYADVMLGRF